MRVTASWFALWLSAMRQATLSETIAQLAIDFRDEGVCGFDIAGPEDGFPPTKHLRAFHSSSAKDFHLTIHAGEAFGLPSIWEAVQFCNASAWDMAYASPTTSMKWTASTNSVDSPTTFAIVESLWSLSDLQRPHWRRGSIATHPIGLLKRLPLSRHPQHRQPSHDGITLSGEFETCASAFVGTSQI